MGATPQIHPRRSTSSRAVSTTKFDVEMSDASDSATKVTSELPSTRIPTEREELVSALGSRTISKERPPSTRWEPLVTSSYESGMLSHSS